VPHVVSQPLAWPSRPRSALASRFLSPSPSLPVPAPLPDAYDRRYPRRWWVRLVRFGAEVWWLPVVAYLAQAATLLAQQTAARGAGTLADGSVMAAALRLDWAQSIALEQPQALPLLALAAVALVLALVGAVRAGRWARADRALEAQVLVLRLARPHERMDPDWMERAMLPAMEWRLRQHRLRRRWAMLALVLLAAAVGAALALGHLPPALLG
jgi:hypothetical protein